jgi:hypothetical protein
VPANPRIIGFLSGGAPDGEGRMLSEIQQWSDARLESVHDFIQWMFPLMEPSPVNPDAPVLDADTIAEARSRPELQEAVHVSLRRMRRFYEGSRHWISPGDIAGKSQPPAHHANFEMPAIARAGDGGVGVFRVSCGNL